MLYPQPGIRIIRTKSGGTVTIKVFALRADGAGSVRAVTDQTGAVVERTARRPYGEEVALARPSTLPGTRGVHPRDLPDPEQLAGPAATGRRREAAAAGQ